MQPVSGEIIHVPSSSEEPDQHQRIFSTSFLRLVVRYVYPSIPHPGDTTREAHTLSGAFGLCSSSLIYQLPDPFPFLVKLAQHIDTPTERRLPLSYRRPNPTRTRPGALNCVIVTPSFALHLDAGTVSQTGTLGIRSFVRWWTPSSLRFALHCETRYTCKYLHCVKH